MSPVESDISGSGLEPPLIILMAEVPLCAGDIFYSIMDRGSYEKNA